MTRTFVSFFGLFKMGLCVVLVASLCDTATAASVSSFFVPLGTLKEWKKQSHACRTFTDRVGGILKVGRYDLKLFVSHDFQFLPLPQDMEDPVAIVLELETLQHVRLHSKGARDCAKLQAWASEAKSLG